MQRTPPNVTRRRPSAPSQDTPDDDDTHSEENRPSRESPVDSDDVEPTIKELAKQIKDLAKIVKDLAESTAAQFKDIQGQIYSLNNSFVLNQPRSPKQESTPELRQPSPVRAQRFASEDLPVNSYWFQTRYPSTFPPARRPTSRTPTPTPIVERESTT